MSSLEHGGRLRQAARRYDIRLSDWLDLSTGINPHGYPVPALPPEVWRRLPETEDGLEAAARIYYGCEQVLATAGSQAAIQALPGLRPPGRVAVLAPCYQEHPAAWQQAGHVVTPVTAATLNTRAEDFEVIVAVNPNNPTAAALAPERLLDWHARLSGRGGWLVVDEAFVDATPALSLAGQVGAPGLIVLRSLGKFFGLAGVRVGFALGPAELLARLGDALGPWPVAGPSRLVARQALTDAVWQAEARRHLPAESARLTALLQDHGLQPQGVNALFAYVALPDAAALADALARRGILVRRFDTPPALRFGLPGNEPEWTRLARALRVAVRSEVIRG